MARRLRATSDRPAAQVLLSLGVMLVLAFGLTATVRPPGAVGSDAPVDTSVSGSPFRGSGVRARVTLTVVLAEAAELTVRVVDYDGKAVRRLVDRRPRERGTHPVAWDGRDDHGRRVADGPYRMRATIKAPSGTVSVEHWVTKAPDAPYPRLPGAIVVAINPGHGGSDTGAIVARTREKSINLDIARRLRRMLQASGIKVVMTRTGDADVNRPAVDRNGNGRIDHTDELIARNDVGNLARADLMLNVHNNATDCGCGAGTEMFINRKRPWSSESRRLARAVQAAHVRRLRAFESSSWKVIDRGVGTGHYMSLRPAMAKARRPSLMPAILGESLYLDRRRERARLNDPRVRTALAAAYFDGVTAWLATRLYGVRYSHIEVPDRLPLNGDGTVRVRIDNTGTRSTSSWRLEARLVPRVPMFDGSGTPGRLVGSVALPNGIAPGASADVELGITMPDSARQWLLKLDVVRPAGRLSDLGVVQPQLRLTTMVPEPTPTPDQTPTPTAAADPSPAPAAIPAPVVVPDLRGVVAEDALDQLLGAGLEPGDRSEAFDDDVAAGAVIRTDPAADSEVEPGTTIDHVVSLGIEPRPTPTAATDPSPAPAAIPAPVVVPDLRGVVAEDALDQLLGAGLEPGDRSEAFDDDVAAGAVIRTDPAAGSEVEPGTTIDHVVSLGIEPRPTPTAATDPSPAPADPGPEGDPAP